MFTLKEIARKNLASAVKEFGEDLAALPETAFGHHFGGKTRTVADIVYEVVLVNDHIGMVLRGEEPFAWPAGDWITAPAEFQAKDVVLERFRASSQVLLATLEGFSEEELRGMIQMESGERTRFQRFEFMTWHLAYHSGQLNFIQALLGDDKMHWG